jgi:hypothetical protein
MANMLPSRSRIQRPSRYSLDLSVAGHKSHLVFGVLASSLRRESGELALSLDRFDVLSDVYQTLYDDVTRQNAVRLTFFASQQEVL